MRKNGRSRALLALALALVVTVGWCLADGSGEDMADPAWEAAADDVLDEIEEDTEEVSDEADGWMEEEPAEVVAPAETTETVQPDEPEETAQPAWEDEGAETGEPVLEDEPSAPETVEPLVIPFPDVAETADYAQMVAALADMGIFQGDDHGNFNPDAAMTRAEMATVLCRLRELENVGEAVFADVPADHWAAGYIAQATANGLMTAAADGGFHPAEPVRCQEAIALLADVSGMAEADIAGGLAVAGTDSVPRSAVARMTYNALL